MKRIYIQVINPLLDICEHACIEQPVEDAKAIDNACRMFGFKESEVDWGSSCTYGKDYPKMPDNEVLTGIVQGTSRLVTIVACCK